MEEPLPVAHGGPSTQHAEKRNIYVLCASFFTVYAGYNTTQVFASKLLGNLGAASVAAFYIVAVFTGGSLPQYLAAKLGARLALFLSGLIYTFYVFSLVYCIVPLMFLATCMNGVAAAVLWTIQPTELNRCTTDENRGFYNSLMWSSLKLSGIPGNVVALLVLQSHGNAPKPAPMPFTWVPGLTDNSGLFIALGSMCGLGSFMFLLFKQNMDSATPTPTRSTNMAWGAALCDSVCFHDNPATRTPDAEKADADDAAREDKRQVQQEAHTSTAGEQGQAQGCGSFVALLRRCPHIKCLVPLMLFSGFNIGVIYGSLSGLMPVLFVPKAFIVIASVECLGSLACGKISDRCGSDSVLYPSYVLVFVALYWCSMAGLSSVGAGGSNLVRTLVPDQDMQWYLGCGLLGLADAGFQSQVYTVVGRQYAGASKVDAFAVFGVMQHAGLALAWVVISVAKPDTSAVFIRNMALDGVICCGAIAGTVLAKRFPPAAQR